MKPGDIFRLDNDAIVEMENQEFSVIWRDKQKNEHRLQPGAQFRITREGLLGLPVEVRASKINPATGKCGRGRPRRFPAAEIYRLFGEEVPEIVETDETVAYVPQNKPMLNGPIPTSQVTNSFKSQEEQNEYLAQEAAKQEEAEKSEEEARKQRVAATLANLGLGGDDDNGDDW